MIGCCEEWRWGTGKLLKLGGAATFGAVRSPTLPFTIRRGINHWNSSLV